MAKRAEDLGAALAEEAAANDDVSSPDAASAYLELRLSFLADLIPPEAMAPLRRSYLERVARW